MVASGVDALPSGPRCSTACTMTIRTVSRRRHIRHRWLRRYRTLATIGLVATWAIATALQPPHGAPVGSAATITHLAALAPVVWLWLCHPRVALRLVLATLAITAAGAAVAGRGCRPRLN